VPADARLARGQEDLRALLLGFDVDPADERRVVDGYLVARAAVADRGGDTVTGEVALLQTFADLAELSSSRLAGQDEEGHAHSAREYFHTYLRSLDVDRAGLPAAYQAKLTSALAHYGVTELDRTPELESAVFRIFLAQQHAAAAGALLSALLRAWQAEASPEEPLAGAARDALERLVVATQNGLPAVADLARGVEFAWFGQPLLQRKRAEVFHRVDEHLRYLDEHPGAADRGERIAEMVRSTEPLVRLLGARLVDRLDNSVMLEVLTRRYYGNKGLRGVTTSEVDGSTVVVAERTGADVVSTAVGYPELGGVLRGLAERLRGGGTVDVDVYVAWDGAPDDSEAMAEALFEVVRADPLPSQVRRLTITVAGNDSAVMHHHFTYRPTATGMAEERLIRGLHPHIAQRMQIERLSKFDLTRVASSDEEVYLFRCTTRDNPADARLVAFAQVRDLTPLRENDGRLIALPTAENTIAACLDSIRQELARNRSRNRLNTNSIVIYVWPPSELTAAELETLAGRVLPTTVGAGLDEILFIARRRNIKSGELEKIALRVAFDATGSTVVTVGEPATEPVQPLDAYRQKVLSAASRGTVYPYELTGLLGDFKEYDLDGMGALGYVDRPKGGNSAAIVAGVVTSETSRHPEGVTRVVLLGDPTKALGALSEAECSRVIAAIDLAEKMQVPLEWYSLSAGARISMESGTENMDWVAAALKRIVEFTQAGGEINIVVAGINVGAQPYWNAEATMLMHTKGILVMTPASAMVLTGKQALDFAGGVSAEDNFGIGGYDRVMGPNGQAQYWAPSLQAAIDVVMSHYDHTYIAPGESAPRQVPTSDPVDRDISPFPHALAESEFKTVGDIFSAANADRKKPFDIRSVMRALSDQDHPVLERWLGMADAETVVVQDVHLGGHPVCLIGIESQAVPRRGFPPTDGPDTYTAGTLFPQSSKKAARAINSASGNRPLVILANLSGFDGSPESMRKLQLEYGAEIGRAIVNFEGPIVFCVVSRYHGGAFVVFSKALNPNMTVLALEGSYASVLGGAAAAAAVFPREVRARAARDERVKELAGRVAAASGDEAAALEAELAELRQTVHSEALSAVGAEFDQVHDIARAVRVGSVDEIVAVPDLRRRVIEAIVPVSTAGAAEPVARA
ncbi:carboxyl transferase domain-containing protein, partial [Tsukamurella soli]|uniref:carboxyl transferase domain-containing protein n=1 Tax=Tsukamurella soli TaxID=644556 RepID=UPI0031EE9DC5